MSDPMYFHSHGKPCPLTGEEIPNDTIFTNHSRPGCYNACGACDEYTTISAELLKLNRKRAATEGVSK